MKHLPTNARGGRDEKGTFGYWLKLADGSEEFWPRAWQVTARAEGWIPPQQKVVADRQRSQSAGSERA